LIFIKRQYEIELSDYYPGELEKFQEVFDVRYIHHTTAIEGNTLTLNETGLVLEKGIAPAKKKLREIHEVENFKNLLKFVKSYKKDISIDFILKLHKQVMRNIDDDSAGSFRRTGVFITGSKYEPPPAVVVQEEMDELIKWYNTKKGKMNPFELAGYFHCRFTQIHPFIDGNGRVGRELLNFILRRYGYPSIIIPVESREGYISSLEKANEGDYGPMLIFLIEIMVEDYVKVLRNNKARFIEAFGEFKPDELNEFIEMSKWSISLIKRYIDKTPKHLKEILSKIMG
jgi:Fic family protein